MHRLACPSGVDEILQAMPTEDTNLLCVLILTGYYLFHILGKGERRFRQEDVRLPNTSTPSYGR